MPVIALAERLLEVRKATSRLLSGWLAGEDFGSDSLPEVHECIPICGMHLDRLGGLGQRGLTNLLEPSTRWHVQVKLEDEPYGYARLRDEDEWRLGSWSRGGLAHRVDSAIGNADVELPSDEHVTLLVEVPPLHLVMLAFIPRDDKLSRTWMAPLALPRRLQRFAAAPLYRLDALFEQIRGLETIQGYVGVADGGNAVE